MGTLSISVGPSRKLQVPRKEVALEHRAKRNAFHSQGGCRIVSSSTLFGNGNCRFGRSQERLRQKRAPMARLVLRALLGPLLGEHKITAAPTPLCRALCVTPARRGVAWHQGGAPAVGEKESHAVGFSRLAVWRRPSLRRTPCAVRPGSSSSARGRRPA